MEHIQHIINENYISRIGSVECFIVISLFCSSQFLHALIMEQRYIFWRLAVLGRVKVCILWWIILYAFFKKNSIDEYFFFTVNNVDFSSHVSYVNHFFFWNFGEIILFFFSLFQINKCVFELNFYVFMLVLCYFFLQLVSLLFENILILCSIIFKIDELFICNAITLLDPVRVLEIILLNSLINIL